MGLIKIMRFVESKAKYSALIKIIKKQSSLKL